MHIQLYTYIYEKELLFHMKFCFTSITPDIITKHLTSISAHGDIKLVNVVTLYGDPTTSTTSSCLTSGSPTIATICINFSMSNYLLTDNPD